jgi:hypothetical protein
MRGKAENQARSATPLPDTGEARFRDRNDDAKGATRLRARLEEVFQRHLAEKHKMKDELDRTA